ncbi:SETMR methyltransferase, partial [Acromyrmex insinuator]
STSIRKGGQTPYVRRSKRNCPHGQANRAAKTNRRPISRGFLLSNIRTDTTFRHNLTSSSHRSRHPRNPKLFPSSFQGTIPSPSSSQGMILSPSFSRRRISSPSSFRSVPNFFSIEFDRLFRLYSFPSKGDGIVTVYIPGNPTPYTVRPHLAKKKVLFKTMHQDNARVHTCSAPMAKFNEFRYELLPHPTYSRFSSDYFLFPNLKKWFRGKRFTIREQLIAEIEAYFEELDKSYYLKKLENR